MNKSELRKKTLEELQNDVISLEEDLFKTNMNLIHGKEKNVKKSRNIRKSIAIVKTILRERSFNDGKE